MSKIPGSKPPIRHDLQALRASRFKWICAFVAVSVCFVITLVRLVWLTQTH